MPWRRIDIGTDPGVGMKAIGAVGRDGRMAQIGLSDPHRPNRIVQTGPSNHSERDAMNFIIWIVVGGLIGWVASIIMKTNAQQGMFLNVVVGIVGAMLGGWLISPLVGAGTVNQGDFSIGSLLVSLLGAVILLAIVKFFRGGKAG